MPRPDGVPLWLRIGRESVWGKRGLIKTGSLWFPLAVLLALEPAWRLDGAAGIGAGCVALFAMAVCRTLASILANDLTDRTADVAAGKRRWILDIPPHAAKAVVLCLTAAGIAVAFLAIGGGAAWGYAASLALGLGYSLPPVRLKERGILGMVGYSLSGALAYAVVPWLWVGGEETTFCLLGSAVFLDKWVNLHFHQVVDYEADQRSAGGTLNVRVGLARLRRSLQWVAAGASVAMGGCLVLLATEAPRLDALAWIGAGLAAAVAVYARRTTGQGRGSSLMHELPCHYLGLTYALFWGLPPLVFVVMGMWLPAVLSGGLLLFQSWHSGRYRYE